LFNRSNVALYSPSTRLRELSCALYLKKEKETANYFPKGWGQLVKAIPIEFGLLLVNHHLKSTLLTVSIIDFIFHRHSKSNGLQRK
jgi:hypothetical protein